MGCRGIAPSIIPPPHPKKGVFSVISMTIQQLLRLRLLYDRRTPGYLEDSGLVLMTGVKTGGLSAKNRPLQCQGRRQRATSCVLSVVTRQLGAKKKTTPAGWESPVSQLGIAESQSRLEGLVPQAQ